MSGQMSTTAARLQPVCSLALPHAGRATLRASPAAPQRRYAKRTRHAMIAGARPEDEIEPVPPAMLSTHGSEEELQSEGEWVRSMVECWLNEEWPAAELLDIHADLGAATGQAYVAIRRREGMAEMGDLVLALAAELLSHDFGPTFVNAFDVSNKVVELLMLRDGRDVCCTSESDRTAIQRYEAQLAASSSSGGSSSGGSGS